MSHKHGSKGGAIVDVSSAASRASGRRGGYVDYAASRGAVVSLTTGLSLEVAAQGIQVSGVPPGNLYRHARQRR